ncbi:MAG TPA: response regulator, partial [Terriglobia bacterium]|nr:response regulator [Terriglobia bacterium]
MVEATSAIAGFIAVVDDDIRVLESLESLLESAGYEVAVFSSGDSFLRSEAVSTVNCVVTDIRMPNIGGLELQRRLKRQRPELPIIFITAHHDERDEQRAVEEGAAGFLRKSFSALEFLGALRRALGKLTVEQ